MGDLLGDLGLIDGVEFRQIPVMDDARGQEQLGILAVVLRIIAIGHVIADAGADGRPVFVGGSNRQHIRDVDAADKIQAVGDELIQRCDRIHIER